MRRCCFSYCKLLLLLCSSLSSSLLLLLPSLFGAVCVANFVAPLCGAQTLSSEQAPTNKQALSNNLPPTDNSSNVLKGLQVTQGLQIIPAPKNAQSNNQTFSLLSSRVRLALADKTSLDDKFAAEDFIADVNATTDTQLRIGSGSGDGKILIGLVDSKEMRRSLQQAGINVPIDLNAEGYVLSVRRHRVIAAGKTAAGTFYAVQTLKQLVRGGATGNAYIQGAEIIDYPTMRWRAVSDDISRGPVPTLAYIKRQLKTFAYLKINMHSLYMEHVLASEAHPLIAPPRGGALTAAEIRELVAYAKQLHIELVPEQQTFGHLHKALKYEKYNELAETDYGDVLAPEKQGSLLLVADWYKEVDKLFPSKFFHIGADETFELGEGQSREAVRARGAGAVYFEHINRVRDVLKPYNRELMMWGDIALNHPDLINRIPKEMIVMNWAYGARESYAARIKPFADAGLRQFVCPGTSGWNQIFPNTDNAEINITNFTRDGQAAGALGMMNTTWDDDGETLFEMNWHEIALGAAAAWQPATLAAPFDVMEFNRNFAWTFFGVEGDDLTDSLKVLGGVNKTLGAGFTTNQLFWQNPFTDDFQMRARTLHDKLIKMRLDVEAARETFLRAGKNARRNQSFIRSMDFAARRFDHLGRRFQVMEKFSREYWTAYLNLSDKVKVRRLRYYSGAIYNNLREMAEELTELRADFREQWLLENRPYALDSVAARYDQSTQTWLDKSKEIELVLRQYEATSVLPAPETFGLGARPEVEIKLR